jgi:hypothetical protein
METPDSQAFLAGVRSGDERDAQQATSNREQSHLMQTLANTRALNQDQATRDLISVPTDSLHPDTAKLALSSSVGPDGRPMATFKNMQHFNDSLQQGEKSRTRESAIAGQQALGNAAFGSHLATEGQPMDKSHPLHPMASALINSKVDLGPEMRKTVLDYLDEKGVFNPVTGDLVSPRTGRIISKGDMGSRLAFPGSQPTAPAPTAPATGSVPALDPSVITKGRNLIAAANAETDPDKKTALLEEARKLVVGATSSITPPASATPTVPLGRNGLPIRPDEHPYDVTKRLVPTFDDKLHTYRPVEKSKDAEDMAAELIQRRQAGIGNDDTERILVGAIDAKAATSFGGVKEGGFQRILDTQFPVRKTTSQPTSQSTPTAPGAKSVSSTPTPASPAAQIAPSSAGTTGPGTPFYPKGSLDSGYAIDGTRLGPGRYEGITKTPPEKGKLGEPESKILRSADEVLDNVRAIREGLKDPEIAKELLGGQGFIARSTSTASDWHLPFLRSVKVPAITDLSPKAADIYARLGVIAPTFVISREGGRPSQKLIELGQPTQPNLNNNANVFNAALDGMFRASIHSRASVEKQAQRDHLAVNPYEPLPLAKSSQPGQGPLSAAEKRLLGRGSR